MTKIKINLIAKLVEENGRKRLAFDRPEYYKDQINRLDHRKKVLVSIENIQLARSMRQNSYWWAACYPVIAECTGYTLEEAHELCIKMFIPPKFLQVKDKEYAIRRGTSELTKAEGVEYTDKLRNLAVELGGYIPTPQEAGYQTEESKVEQKELPKYPEMDERPLL